MDMDKNKIADAAMAMLALTMFSEAGVHRAWKGIDWDVMDDLFQRGWIQDPKGTAKSVVFTEQGRAMALACAERLFGGTSASGDVAGSDGGAGNTAAR